MSIWRLIPMVMIMVVILVHCGCGQSSATTQPSDQAMLGDIRTGVITTDVKVVAAQQFFKGASMVIVEVKTQDGRHLQAISEDPVVALGSVGNLVRVIYQEDVLATNSCYVFVRSPHRL